MPISIHGKQYLTVAERVNSFREKNPNWGIETEIVSNDAEIIIMKAVIKDESGRVVGTGYAEEQRNSSHINKTSALENGETSAIGRALACIGYGGEQYASANEVSEAVIDQAKQAVASFFIKHNEKVKEHLSSIECIKATLKQQETSGAAEAWLEIPQEDQKVLWLAPTKGGIFTTEEREMIKSSEFRKATHPGETE